MAPPKPTSPATAPIALRGYMSAGRIITSVDHDCCPKYAMLKMARAQATGTFGMKSTRGIRAALAPSAILRERFRDTCRVSNQLENQPPARQPTPAAAYGIQAKAPTALMSNPRASYRYLGSQNR